MIVKETCKMQTSTIEIETGRMGNQANGAVTVRAGDTIVFGAVCASNEPDMEKDFFPLMVDYREKFYAAGKIPGGFFKRESRPDDRQTLVSRLIDRPIRPLFADGFRNEVIISLITLSADHVNSPDILAPIAASACLMISDIPFQGPIGLVRVGCIDDKFVINPTYEDMEKSTLDLLIAGTKDSVMMVEAGAKEISEEKMLEALDYGHKEMQPLIEAQERLAKTVGKEKIEVTLHEIDAELEKDIREFLGDDISESVHTVDKQEREDKLSAVFKKTFLHFEEKMGADEYEKRKKDISEILEKCEKEVVRGDILYRKTRADGRGLDEIRTITTEAGILPCAHGSALFTRGQTQALASTTLGTGSDEQRLDSIEGEGRVRFLLHYNFPPFSVGEARPTRAPGRREIGHGALARRALEPVMPDQADFPYTIRVVSDIMESNGSSSMASVCGGILSLQDAGVPIKAPVAGIAMGLVMEGDKYAILSDIMGMEDHLGDMDFKVAGTTAGVTALQMDIKVKGITAGIMRDALKQAHEGRAFILGKMAETLKTHRDDISPFAPRIVSHKIPKEKIGSLIGPGGKNIRSIQEETNVKIEVNDEGEVLIYSSDKESLDIALEKVKNFTEEAEIGKTYTGKVTSVKAFGAFIEIIPGTEGLCHISELAHERVNEVTDILNEGDTVDVKVLDVDRGGKIRLSRRALLPGGSDSGRDEKKHDGGRRFSRR